MVNLVATAKTLNRGLALFPSFIHAAARGFAATPKIPQGAVSIPQLAVLENTKRLAMQQNILPNLENTIVIGVQHILESTGSLFKTLVGLGVSPRNMFFTGKCYSTNPQVAATIQEMGITLIPGTTPTQLGKYHQAHLADVERMWELCQQQLSKTKQVDRIIIIDDGAATMQTTPSFLIRKHPVVSIEQTRAGIYENMQDYLPVINVAQSAAKRHLEAELIQKKIISKLKGHLTEINKSNTIIGVVGCGAIGLPLALELAREGYEVSIYDDNPTAYPTNLPKNIQIASSLTKIFLDSDVVFGCTGRDITENVDLLRINNQNRTLISCSSGDMEFNTLLNQIGQLNKIIKVNTLNDIECINFKNREIRIINGGFPANFDRQAVSVPNEQIALTRGLLLSAFIQAAWLTARYSPADIRKMGNIMLAPELQQYVIREWQKTLDPNLQAEIPFHTVETLDLIKKNSEGLYSSQALGACLEPLKEVPRPQNCNLKAIII